MKILTVATACVLAGASGLKGEINPMVKKNQAVIGAHSRADLLNSFYATSVDAISMHSIHSVDVVLVHLVLIRCCADWQQS